MALITWEDVVAKYPEIEQGGVTDATKINSLHIPFAEARLTAALGTQFGTPFTRSNLTAIDIAVDLTYVRVGWNKLDKAQKVKDDVEAQIAALQRGDSAMAMVDGTLLFFQGGAWSSDIDYPFTFGHGDIEDFKVSEQQLQDEEDARE